MKSTRISADLSEIVVSHFKPRLLPNSSILRSRSNFYCFNKSCNEQINTNPCLTENIKKMEKTSNQEPSKMKTISKCNCRHYDWLQIHSHSPKYQFDPIQVVLCEIKEIISDNLKIGFNEEMSVFSLFTHENRELVADSLNSQGNLFDFLTLEQQMNYASDDFTISIYIASSSHRADNDKNCYKYNLMIHSEMKGFLSVLMIYGACPGKDEIAHYPYVPARFSKTRSIDLGCVFPNDRWDGFSGHLDFQITDSN